MKDWRYFFFMLSLMWMGISCSNDDKAEDPELILSKTELNFPQQGAEKVFYVKSSDDWTLSGATDWCTVSPLSGEGGHTTKLTVTVNENRTNDARTATLTVESGGQTKTLIVEQTLGMLLQQTSYEVNPEGEVIPVSVLTTGGYTVTIHDDWIAQPAKVKAVSEEVENFVIAANYTGKKRTGTVTFTWKKIEETVTFVQDVMQAPDADKTGMESDAKTLASKIKVGWNLGNSLESSGGETAWGNPKTTQATIDMVKAAGFNAVRIPCNWSNGYLSDEANYTIKESWLARVKEVVDYCVGNDMYAIINIHYDGGWLELNPTYAKQEEVNQKQRALWMQIATYFRGYDEHLLFAGTNEVRIEGVYDNNQVTDENHAVQQSFNQTFVDAVRATGGKNVYRNLIVQAYNTNIDLAVSKLVMPTDDTDNRMMMEVHFYAPWEFAGSTTDAYWGKPYESFGLTSWGGQEDYVDAQFSGLKKKFVDAGYPVILGEYGANRHSMTNQDMINSRAYYLEYVTKAAKNNGMVPFYWDNGGMGNGDTADQFGIFDRNGLKVYDQPAVDAIMRGAEAGSYPMN